MPVFNAQNRLRLAVHSILDQSYENLELILVDDGSTDCSPGMCDEFAAVDRRVNVIHQPNSGVSVARNRGMAEASGDYISFADADDTLELDAYSVVMSQILEGRYDVGCYGMRFCYHRGGLLLETHTFGIGSILAFDPKLGMPAHFFQLFEQNYLSSVCNKVIRTALIRENDLRFDSRMAILEDFKFVLEVFEHANSVVAIPDPLYNYYKDLDLPSLGRRPHIDYLSNFRALDDELQHFGHSTGLTDSTSAERLCGMTFRFYLIGIERLFESDISHRERYRQLQKYLGDEDVRRATVSGIVSGQRLKLVHWLARERHMRLLYVSLIMNRLTKRTRRKTLPKFRRINHECG